MPVMQLSLRRCLLGSGWGCVVVDQMDGTSTELLVLFMALAPLALMCNASLILLVCILGSLSRIFVPSQSIL